MPDHMITQEAEKCKEKMEAGRRFLHTFTFLGLPSLLKQANIRNANRRLCGEKDENRRSAYTIFQFLLLLVFQGENLFRYLNSKKQDCACSKNTYYRFLNNCHYNWSRFLTLLSSKVIGLMDALTGHQRVKSFVLDDSVIERERSKKVELLARVFDHVRGKCVKGFTLLTLGWTDNYSFVPVGFSMLSSAKEKNRLAGIDSRIDKRTNGYQRRKEAILPKTDVAMCLIRNALRAGIRAAYVLMDTWFTNEPFIGRIVAEGLDVIGMLKDTKQQYWYKGRLYNLHQLAHFVNFSTNQDVFGSVFVKTKYQKIAAKLVFVRNRNKKSEYIVILSTDCALSDDEIVRNYGARWSIECCFKVCKSFLKLGSEFHGISYDMTISSTAIVFTRFIILEWIRREDNDPRTAGDLFFLVYDEIRDLELTEALRLLLDIVATGLRDGTIKIAESLRNQLVEWFFSQPKFIQSLFPMFITYSGISDAGIEIPCQ